MARLPRLALGLVSLGFVVTVPYAKTSDGLPTWFYALLLLGASAASVTSQTMFVAQMAFFSRVSDPRIGGTYMTMLNTIANLGTMWPRTTALVTREEVKVIAKV